MACLIAGCAASLVAEPLEQGVPTRFTFTEYHMGVDARLVVYASDDRAAQTACEAAFVRIAELEAIMSDYRQNSELMRLCAAAGGHPVRISPDLYRVLERAQALSKQTDGGFDVTVGPLVQLWRKARREQKLPDPVELELARGLVDWKKLRLDSKRRTAQLLEPGMRLDLGGIAKGYASDEALKVLRKHRIRSALVEMGGDIVLGDAPPGTEGWTVDVPNAGRQMALRNRAISSSGDTEQFVEIDGVRFSHVVDPKTGLGLTRRAQATVIAPSGFLSDPLSTALTLLDDPGRTGLLRHYRSVQAFVKTVS